MKLAVDLHSHSGYAGGVGQIELTDVAATMKRKGIDVFGTGDALLPQRCEELKQVLTEREPGLFSLGEDRSRFLLQTEVILSTRIDGYKNKIVAHHVILFPDFSAIEKMQKLMTEWKMKNTIGRPFIVTNSQDDLEEKLFQIQAIDPMLEIIPAHVMTPDGILGSKNNLKNLKQFYGEFLTNIRIVETGLSADPQMLSTIPDLANLTYVSNSDCHSAALNRIGREFTMIDCDEISYVGIVNSLRTNRVDFTAEFNPAEGRYFQTGHRANRQNHECEVIFQTDIPEDLLCPICGKKMNLGVKQRCQQLQDDSITPLKRGYKHLIPLVEVLAHALKLKSITSRKVVNLYDSVMNVFPSEIALWQSIDINLKLSGVIPDNIIIEILAVQKGEFTFDPAGYDGNYGVLKIGKS